MQVRQMLVSDRQLKVKCPYEMEAESYTVHNTYNDASANNEVAYMIRNHHEISFHYAIDDIEAVQGIPENRNAWAAGDGGKGKGNRTSIHIEICYSKSGGERYHKAEQNAIEFIAQGLKAKGWGIDRVKKHQDWSGKNCPHRILDEGRWNSFLAEIEKEQKGEQTAQVPKPAVAGATSQTKANLKVDGYLGPETIKALQRYFGTVVDGIISKPSLVIKVLQKWIGVKHDGYLGPITISALQRRFGTPVDGKISKPSLVIKELQKRLNKGNLG